MSASDELRLNRLRRLHERCLDLARKPVFHDHFHVACRSDDPSVMDLLAGGPASGVSRDLWLSAWHTAKLGSRASDSFRPPCAAYRLSIQSRAWYGGVSLSHEFLCIAEDAAQDFGALPDAEFVRFWLEWLYRVLDFRRAQLVEEARDTLGGFLPGGTRVTRHLCQGQIVDVVWLPWNLYESSARAIEFLLRSDDSRPQATPKDLADRAGPALGDQVDHVALWDGMGDVLRAVEDVRNTIYDMTEAVNGPGGFEEAQGLSQLRGNIRKALLNADRLLRETRFHGPMTFWGKWDEKWDVWGPPEESGLAGYTACLRSVRDLVEALLLEMLHGRDENYVEFWKRQGSKFDDHWKSLDREAKDMERKPAVREVLLRRARNGTPAVATNAKGALTDVPLADRPNGTEAESQEKARPEGKPVSGGVLILTPLQRAILKALDGKAMKKEPLADAVKCDPSRLYRPGGIKELMARALVAKQKGVGYYRPDAPPADALELSVRPDRNQDATKSPNGEPTSP